MTGGQGSVDVWAAAALYLAAAVFVTWPLSAGLASDVPSDLGDPLLNMWILAWEVEQIKAILGGDLARIGRFFDANIFYPAPLTLAYSEHLFPQALQILPVYLLTGNPILCYNLLFLSTYVLSGVGGYLLVRELTGSWKAAFLAGLLFALAPYRLAQASHLHVLSSQWMPFTLYGFTCYLNSRRRLALAGGAAALVLQALSSGYYLLYFVPFAAAYLLWEIGRRGLWRDRRLWLEVGVAGAVSIAAILPFVMAYARLRATTGMTRGLQEIAGFSADVYSYFTAYPLQRVWGPLLNVFPRAEGELFPGAVMLALGALGFAMWAFQAWRAGQAAATGPRMLSTVLGTAAAICLAVAMVAIFERRIVVDAGLFTIRITSIGRVLVGVVGLAGVLLAVSPRARAQLRGLLTVEGFFCLAIGACWWLSLGPYPRALGRPLDLPAPYRFLVETVPGFDGVRVPARYAMVMACMLAVAGGLAAAPWLRRRGGTGGGTAVLAVLSALCVFEAHGSTFPINGVGTSKEYVLPEARMYRPARAPAIYHRVAALPADTVLLELPLGDPNWDLYSVYYSIVHWRPLVNGYSGFFPPGYRLVALAVSDPDRDPALATDVLRATGATHVVVHERAYRNSEADELRRWLNGMGARNLARDGTDVIYEIGR